MIRKLRYGLVCLLALLTACAEQKSEAPELLVYSARNEHLIKPLFDRFTEQTGIPIRYVTDSAGPLLTRLQAEGENTPADLLMTVDAGNLWQAAEVGVLASTESAVLLKNIPAGSDGIPSIVFTSWLSMSMPTAHLQLANTMISICIIGSTAMARGSFPGEYWHFS